MKKSSFKDSFSTRIIVSDKKLNTIGYLVPVGEWILSEKKKIEQISAWRQKNMRMFLTQFASTFEKTFGYLKKLSIAQEGRIFFLLYDSNDRFVGHMGVADVDGNQGELDNLMRGVNGGDPGLIFFAEVALLNWCFQTLGIVKSDVRVLSYNWIVISLHEEVGYKLIENVPLKKITKDEVIFHEVSTIDDANVKYSCTRMSLDRNEFYEKHSWLT